MGRLFITGDIHGSIDIARLSSANFPLGRELSKDDYLIVAGDFGLPWSYPESKEDKYWLAWLEAKPWTTLFVDGNHENFDALETLPVEQWNGGRVQFLRPGIVHLMRGEFYTLHGVSFFTLGGARSVDQIYRTEHVSWWPQEMPSEDDRAHALQTLDAHQWNADIVVTHCAPSIFQHTLDPSFENDSATLFLQNLERDLSYKHWYFGHYHLDQDIPWGSASALYNRILEIYPDHL